MLPDQAKVAATPLLAAAGKMAATECRKVMRRLHAVGPGDKREKRRAQAPYARLMAKISHANPLAVFQTIVHQVGAVLCSMPPDQATRRASQQAVRSGSPRSHAYFVPRLDNWQATASAWPGCCCLLEWYCHEVPAS